MLRRSLTSSLSLLALAVLPGLFGACGSDGSQVMPEPPGPTDPTAISRTYHQDAKAVLDHYCADCHQSGGIAPFSLTSYEDAQKYAAQIKGAVESGRMPPWLPSDDGLALRHARNLSKDDKATLLDWVAQGAAAGDAAAPARVVIPPAEKVVPPRADLVLDPGVTYMPQTGVQGRSNDDYRCFILDPKLTADRYLRAGSFQPGNANIVHHIIVFEVPQAEAAKIRAKDDAEAGPGYTCFGGAGSGKAQFVMGWAPGGVPMRLHDDEGILLHKGSLLVMQVHYNLLKADGNGDRTKATLEFTDAPPPVQALVVPFANPNALKIKAGDPAAKQIVSVPIALVLSALKLPSQDLYVTAIAPHMHTLGTRLVTRIEDGDTLINIPRWDFHWQQAYQFKETVTVRKTDTLTLECQYDNSYANQPVIDGMQQMPRDVTWGEGTLDEMCLTFLTLRMPQQAPTK